MKTVENLGLANRNPLNIRYDARNRWLGLDENCPSVGGFCRFRTMAHGYRAAVVLMKTYIAARGCRTVEQIVSRWAPPQENHTQLYVAAVCGRTRMAPDEEVRVEGPQIARLVAAMARQETGAHPHPDYIDELRRRFGV